MKIIIQDGDHLDIWVAPSYHHASGGLGLYARFIRYRPHYCIGKYAGTTNLNIGFTAQDAMILWAQDDYVLFYPARGFVMKGARTNRTSYASDGFCTYNSYVQVNPTTGKFELALRGQPEHGIYETPIKRTRLEGTT